MRRHVVLLAAACLLAGQLIVVGSVAAADPAARGLSKEDRAALARAEAGGADTVTVLIAARAGANRAVATGIAGLGGTVRFREDSIDYIRATVPASKVEAATALKGVQSLEVDSVIPLPDPRPGDDATGATLPDPQPTPGAGTPANNPYMPIGDTGAAQFRAAHPTWDGRGVTVGILDLGIAIDHPALQTTTTGQPKIIDWVTYTDPATDNDPTWVAMSNVVSGPTFTVGSGAGAVTYTAPAAASFRFGVFNERSPQLGGEVGNDVNRDGNPAGSSGLFGVLWDGATTVWVDTNQNRSFADEAAMTDYKVNRDSGFFGTDNPATQIAERMPFVVQIDGKNKFVNIGIVSGAHGTHVAGITAGNGLFGGAMTGAAPGAQLVSVRVCLFVAGCTAHALVEGMIYAAKTANVDVINMSIGGLPALNDANNTRAVLYNRLIEQYSVQMFISAGNSGPGVNTIGDPSVASNVVSVGAYVTDATWQSNYGSSAPAAGTDNLHPFSSRGPREDGGFKPDVVAPGAAVSSAPLWQPGGPVPGTYALPSGYAMMNGTSMAAPQATGAGALLVSAAEQAGVQHQPAQLRQALRSSARFLTNGYGAYEQGNGLIQVGAAWALLASNAIKTVDISSSVEVNTVLSSFLATPGRGTGIYDREGVTAGVSYDRHYVFRRTSGSGGTKTYNATWVGNDGTFSSGGSIALPLNVAVPYVVSVNPTAGIHSAILNLDDPTNPGIEYQTLNTVIAAQQFTAAGSYTQVVTGSVARNEAQHFFFNVPAGAPAFKVDFTGPTSAAGTGQARFLRFHPYGVPIDSNASTSCYIPSAGSCAESPSSRTVTDPQAGVWEVTVEARRTSDVDFTPYTLTASILGASVTPNPDIIPSATIGVPVARSYTLTNLFGAFTGRAVGTNLGSAIIDRPTIGNHLQQTYTVEIPTGTASLRATIGDPSDPAADLDLFVIRPNGTIAGQSADGDSEESVTVSNPVAGTWTILVDGYSVPSGSTDYDYIDVFFTTAPFGTISVTDAIALRAAGAVWTVPATVTANAAPATGRVLYGNVEVRTDTNVLVGSGDVIVENVVGP